MGDTYPSLSPYIKRRPPLVLYHGNCADGHCAAWVYAKAWQEHLDSHDTPYNQLVPEYKPVQYGQAPPTDEEVTDRDVIILDFSYDRDTLLRIAKQCHSFLLLDHHKTAAEALKDFPKSVTVDGAYGPVEKHVFVHFDMERSGAGMTWDNFYPGSPRPWLVDYVEDRDLWRFKLASSKEINAAIASFPMTFEAWDSIELAYTPSTMASEGKAITRYQQQLVTTACHNAVEILVAGRAVRCVNATNNISEIAGTLAKDRPFGVSYFINQRDGQVIWSLRSREGGEDVSVIAKRFGGGGHKGAAGFHTPMPTVEQWSAILQKRQDLCDLLK